MLKWLLWTCERLSDLCGIYCIVLQGKFQPSGSFGQVQANAKLHCICNSMLLPFFTSLTKSLSVEHLIVRHTIGRCVGAWIRSYLCSKGSSVNMFISPSAQHPLTQPPAVIVVASVAPAVCPVASFTTAAAFQPLAARTFCDQSLLFIYRSGNVFLKTFYKISSCFWLGVDLIVMEATETKSEKHTKASSTQQSTQRRLWIIIIAASKEKKTSSRSYLIADALLTSSGEC